MAEQNGEQIALLNDNFDFTSPQMLHKNVAAI